MPTNEYIIKTRTEGVRKTQGQLKSLGGGLGSLAGKVTLVAGAFYGAKKLLDGFKESIGLAGRLETGMKEVGTLMGGISKNEMASLSKELRNLSIQSGQALNSLVKAKYDIVSAGFSSASESAKVLNTSTQLAVGGITSVANAADLLTTSLNAYGFSADKTNEVSDSLFTTVKLGKTTINELSSSFGRVLPFAKTAGIRFDDVGASMALLTSKGINTAESTTALAGAFRVLGMPTTGIRKAMEEAGFEIKKMDDGSTDLLGTLEEFKKVDEATFVKLVPDATAQLAIKTMMDDIDGLATNITVMEGKANASQNAFDQMSDTWEFRLKQTSAKINNIMIDIGDTMIVALSPAIDKLNEMLNFFGKIDWTQTGQNIIDNTSALGTAVVETLKVYFDFIPDLFRNSISLIWNILKTAFEKLVELIKTVANLIWEPLVISAEIMITKIKKFFDLLATNIANAFRIAINEIKEIFNELADTWIGEKLGLEPLEASDLVDVDALATGYAEQINQLKERFADTKLGTFIMGVSEDNIQSQQDIANALVDIWGNYWNQVGAMEEENKPEGEEGKPATPIPLMSKKDVQDQELNAESLAGIWEEYGKAKNKTSNSIIRSTINEGVAHENLGKTAEKAIKKTIGSEAKKIVMSLISSIMTKIPFPFNIALSAGAGAIAGGLIESAISSISRIGAEEGFSGIVNKPTMFMTGESGSELVNVTPLERQGLNAPGQSINVNVSGNIMTQDFVEGELADAIREASRRGTEFGVS